MSPAPHTLLLASASPRRTEILTQMGIHHQVLSVPAPPGEDEPRLDGESPTDYVRRTALDKARHARLWLQQHDPARQHLPILAADTTVALGTTILGKPADAAQAAQFLRQLSGGSHQVLSAVVLNHSQHTYQALNINHVFFAQLSDDDIQRYCRTDEPMGKAGAYAIQGVAAAFVTRIEGSHSGIMGLPIRETHVLLQQAGLSDLCGWLAAT